MKNTLKTAMLAIGALALVGEIGTRAAGMSDFPLYGTDAELGYWILPNQSGAFMNKNHWAFNNLGMPIAEDFKPSDAIDIPVIGNSIIMGGNAYDQKDKIPPVLQNLLGAKYRIWPVAAGGWSNVNEAVYLKRHPEITRHADFFIWEVMYGGFSGPSTWRGEYVFPKEKPLSALWYAARRYVLPKFIDFNMDELPPRGVAQNDHLKLVESQIEALIQATSHKPQATSHKPQAWNHFHLPRQSAT